MPVMFFDDFRPGDEFLTPARTITETDVVNFAGVSGDFNSIHTDRTFGAETQFDSVIAHGLLITSVVTGLISRLGIFDGSLIAMLGIDEWKFHKPVIIGDTVRARMTIVEARPTAKPDRGLLRRKIEVLNQRNEAVQTGVIISLCRRGRPAES